MTQEGMASGQGEIRVLIKQGKIVMIQKKIPGVGRAR